MGVLLVATARPSDRHVPESLSAALSMLIAPNTCDDGVAYLQKAAARLELDVGAAGVQAPVHGVVLLAFRCAALCN